MGASGILDQTRRQPDISVRRTQDADIWDAFTYHIFDLPNCNDQDHMAAAARISQVLQLNLYRFVAG